MRVINRDWLQPAARAVQYLCLLAVLCVEILYFLPGHPADNLLYTFLEWRLVDVSILFLAASLCCGGLRRGRRQLLLALLTVIWFYVVRSLHLQLEQTAKTPGVFVCGYALCFLFAAAAGDGERQWGLKGMAALFSAVSIVFSLYAALLVLNRLPDFLADDVYWDGARLGILSHPNICATLLMVGSGLSVGFALSVKQWRLRIPLLLLAVPPLWALSLTNSRTMVILACVQFGAITFFALKKPGWKRTAAAVLAAILVTVSLFAVSRTIFAGNKARLTEQARQQTTGEVRLNDQGTLKTENGQGSMSNDLRTLNGRTEIWAAAAEGLRANPRILLIGTEKVGETISPYWQRMDTLHAHNSWVEALYQLGLPGLVSALVLTVLALWNAAVLLRHNNDLWKSCVAVVMLGLLGCAFLEPYLFTVNIKYHFFDFLFLLCLGYMNQWRIGERGRYEFTE